MKDNIERIRHILDKAKLCHRLIDPDEGAGYPEILFSLEQDNDCSEEVLIVIGINDAFMTERGFMANYVVDELKRIDAVLFCNTWNATHFMPQVCVSDAGKIVTSWCNVICEDIPDEYIKENMILSFSKATWDFFCEFTKEFLK